MGVGVGETHSREGIINYIIGKIDTKSNQHTLGIQVCVMTNLGV